MVSVFSLWLPILVAAVFVFVASSILHMVLPIHRGDYRKIPDEDRFLDGLREQPPSPGEYAFPFATMKEMTAPETVAKYERGPVGLLVVMPNGLPQMGKSLVQWFLFSLLISICAAYVASVGLPAGARYLTVFRVTCTVATVGYAASALSNSIWKAVPWSTTLKFVVDGLVYGLVTAGAFAWLWPDAA